MASDPDVLEPLTAEDDLRTAAESIDRAASKLAVRPTSPTDARDLADARSLVIRVYGRQRALQVA